ncbi:MAG: large conductance mechanosensitive channel protein MscL [Clostridia bacterium]|nr:large conductance mechanosensitive channel protein MscL [Clostridia bacterium]
MAKEKKEGRIKKFFGEFKKFITRGNVLDMAVGVIVGGAFTAIVNGLSNYILKPLINALLATILKGEGLEGAVTMLVPAYFADQPGVVDLANSIYIDWGAFVSAIINFLLTAFALFMIVKIINQVAEAREKAIGEEAITEKKAIYKIVKEQKVSRKEAIAIRNAQIAEAAAKKAEEARLAEEKASAEKAEAERIAEEKAMANTRLLEEIRDLLKQK